MPCNKTSVPLLRSWGCPESLQYSFRYTFCCRLLAEMRPAMGSVLGAFKCCFPPGSDQGFLNWFGNFFKIP